MNSAKNILLGVTGGIAAYRAPELVRLLRKSGIGVRAAMTKNAELFVTPMTLETVSERKVWQAGWKGQENPLIHLTESHDYDLALIAPATANFIGKLAGGIADDLLSTLSLALTCPVYVAPAMNPRMYSNRAVADNLDILKKRGFIVIPPAEGETACGEVGEGRLPPLSKLVEIIRHGLGLKSDMQGVKIVVTAGRTEEPLDPVRYLSNRSSGKMGLAIASAARDRGADVTLIHGVISEKTPENIKNIPVRTAREMYSAVSGAFPGCDALVMTAAVADYRPAEIARNKIKKAGGRKTIELTENPDILASMGKKKAKQIVIGFAAETENAVNNGRKKLLEKNADLICVNDVSRLDIGFDNDFNELTFVTKNGARHSGKLAKRTLAEEVLDIFVELTGEERRTAAGGNE